MNTQKRMAVLLLGCTLWITGCTKVLDFRNAEISNGKVFEAGANTPFSGKLTNIPQFKLPTTPIIGLSKVIMNATGDNGFYQLFFTGGIAGILETNGGSVLCNVDIKQGRPQGEANCQLPTLDMPLLKMQFKDGNLDGTVFFYDYRVKDKVIAEFPFLGGQVNGPSKIYSPKTGKLVHTASWVNGQGNGVEEAFDENTGAIKFHGVLVNNRYDGEMINYDSNGTPTSSFWKDGQPVQQTSTLTPSADTTAPVSLMERIGVPSNETPAATECIDQWTAAFRKEKGDDALVSSEQLNEWEGWCAAGKKP